jgi:hypothetical protein
MPVDDRSAQLEIPMDSVLRPRDIQARIRSGESPETVAAAAQTSVDKIMGFATPVLAERSYVAEQALKASVRRRAGDGPVGHLAEAVAERLRSRDIDPDAVEWDSWRREDGRWTVAADYLSGDSARHAEFVYDTHGRYVVADDEESRWLVGERSAHHGPQPRPSSTAAPSASAPRRPLAPVDEQLPLGEDAIELVTGQPPRPLTEPVEEPTVDLTETASNVRAFEPRVAREAPTDADWIATQASERPEPAPEPEPQAGPQPAPESAPELELEPEPVDELFSVPPEAVSEPEPEPEREPEPEPRKPGAAKKAARGRRASVPSWDEIMFGSDKQS